jgi:hypothetical protein
MPKKIPVDVEYNRDLKPLELLLAGIQRPGDFFVNGRFEAPVPKIQIDGVGIVSFPVPQTQIKEIIGQADRAPYGRGELTVLDTSVRNAWQVDAAKVHIGGKSWERTLQEILRSVAAGLGCVSEEISAVLYKLLVYEKGGFFKAHRDTEKSDGMFGTLVIVLPAAHNGGELIVHHAGRKTTIDLSGNEASELAFAAFYADCEHEVQPVTQGGRVCLDYNLVQVKGRKKRKQITAPDYQVEANAAATLLRKALSQPNAPLKIAWLLEHQYSPAGLSFSALKNADSARAKVLSDAAAIADCCVHLGIVHIEEYGSAIPSYDDDYYGRSFRDYRHGEDEEDAEDEEDESADDKDFEIIEVDDGDHFIDEWIDAQNRRVDFGRIPLDAGELIPDGALDDEKPDKQRVMEASGNEGATFERSYHRAALIIWLRSHSAKVLLPAGVGAAIPLLREFVSKGDRNQASILARQILKHWESPPQQWQYGRDSTTPNRSMMLDLMCRLGDVQFVERFIGETVTKEYDGSENAVLIEAAPILGPAKIRILFGTLMFTQTRKRAGHCVQLLAGLVKLDSESKFRSSVHHVAASLVDALANSKGTSTASTVADLMDCLIGLSATELRGHAAAAIVANVAGFNPVTAVVPALALLHQRHGVGIKSDAYFGILWQHAAEFLLARSERPPEPPSDWKQSVTLSCGCADCIELQRFARASSEQVHRFNVRKDRRQHLHRTIDQHDLDMTHVTERKGSPQTLVCSKTRRGYQRQRDQYQADRAAMAALLPLLPENWKESALATRVLVACNSKA